MERCVQLPPKLHPQPRIPRSSLNVLRFWNSVDTPDPTFCRHRPCTHYHSYKPSAARPVRIACDKVYLHLPENVTHSPQPLGRHNTVITAGADTSRYKGWHNLASSHHRVPYLTHLPAAR